MFYPLHCYSLLQVYINVYVFPMLLSIGQRGIFMTAGTCRCTHVYTLSPILFTSTSLLAMVVHMLLCGYQMKQHNVDAHELDLTIASDASHLLWQNHGEVMDDGLFRAENNVDSTDDAAADHHHDNRRVSESHEKRADKRFKRHRNEQTKELEVYN